MARKQLAFYGSFHGIKFDKASFSKTFEAKAQVLVRNAAREWLRAVLTKVPIWTGMSRGSIVLAKGKVGGVGLARYLNMAIPTPHPNSRPKWYYPNPGSKYRLPKTPETGGQRGEYAFPSTQHRYRFRYTNNVIQVGIGELFGTQKAGL